MRFHTVGRGSTSLLGRALEADDEGDAPPADVGCGGLAGALARRQRSALVALACPDLPPSALSGRGLHLQAQQRARCALGRHERACVSGYRPHLRAAATARAVMAVHAGLATDEAAEARERQEVENLQKEHQIWERLLKAAKEYAVANRELDAASDKDNKRASKLRKLGEALKAVIAAVEAIDYTDVLNELMQQTPCGPVAEARQSITACGSMLVGVGGLPGAICTGEVHGFRHCAGVKVLGMGVWAGARPARKKQTTPVIREALLASRSPFSLDRVPGFAATTRNLRRRTARAHG